ncbi:Mannosyl-3-phosphoglycerate phosphatase [Ruegeria sp. THAF57]|uniref:HAD-IIB family hydrolase n=1 Tax=Ruegeria sp. THAF57 TaxID=2744555 RepID=UPI0015DF3F03|nr:HAD hydrolase family protein [Ruegeria sp. THAF57]CAD0186710.1 Mannosyl-3-phosphoglycerate phosphatase [Ruegeria sp. THAF57]
MTADPKLLVFSDLDGTLLDHHNYRWAAAQPGLKRLSEIGAGLVLASSKTAAEIAPLQQELGSTRMPAIVENGAGILWPDAPDIEGDRYQDLRTVLSQLPTGFVGFGDMSDQDVADATGLNPIQAARARTRRFSEPGLWTGTEAELDRFVAQARNMGLFASRGGRFLTMSFGKTKADALRDVVQQLRPSRSIALGDAPNDIEMLMAADQGVVVANPDGPGIPPFPPHIESRIFRTDSSGPQGWSEAILTLTAEF